MNLKLDKQKLLEMGLIHYFRCHEMDRDQVQRFMTEDQENLKTIFEEHYSKIISMVNYVFSLELECDQ